MDLPKKNCNHDAGHYLIECSLSNIHSDYQPEFIGGNFWGTVVYEGVNK